MKTNHKLIFAIAFFIILGALFISGCKSPIGPVGFPESFDTATEDTLQEIAAPAEPDTVSAPSEPDTAASAPSKLKPLTLVIKNLASPKAPVHVAFYAVKNKFLSKTDRLKAYKFVPDGDVLTVQIKNLSYGDFAIAAYQDVNSDGKCNRSMVGIPKEPYGFSNDIKPTLKAPRFDECKFTYDATANTHTFSMIR